jgi:hypothetical protein
VTPSGAVWLANYAVRTGAMGPDKTIEALRNYIAAFLDANLRGKPFDPLLRGPSSDYPDSCDNHAEAIAVQRSHRPLTCTPTERRGLGLWSREKRFD